jgi:ActR/RegA family two-component response regulator
VASTRALAQILHISPSKSNSELGPGGSERVSPDDFEMEMEMASVTKKKKKLVALVVDDDVQVCRALARIIGTVFDELLTTTSPGEVEEILKHHAVTHLLSDFDFGEGAQSATGFDYVVRWRRQCPTIERAIVFTGADLSGIPRPEEVDAVIPKWEGVHAILEHL